MIFPKHLANWGVVKNSFKQLLKNPKKEYIKTFIASNIQMNLAFFGINASFPGISVANIESIDNPLFWN